MAMGTFIVLASAPYFFASQELTRYKGQHFKNMPQGNENAYMVSQGTLSFSNFFWTHVFNGLPLSLAFDLARTSTTGSFRPSRSSADARGVAAVRKNSQPPSTIVATINRPRLTRRNSIRFGNCFLQPG